MRHSSVIRSTMLFVVLIAATEAFWPFGSDDHEEKKELVLIDQKHVREMATIKASSEVRLSEEETKREQLKNEAMPEENKKLQILTNCIMYVSFWLIIGVCFCVISWLIYKCIANWQNADQINDKRLPVNLNVNDQADPSTSTGQRTQPSNTNKSNDIDDCIRSGAPTTKERENGKPAPPATNNANLPNNREQEEEVPSSSTEDTDLCDRPIDITVIDTCDNSDDTNAGQAFADDENFNSTSDPAGARRRRLLKFQSQQ